MEFHGKTVELYSNVCVCVSHFRNKCSIFNSRITCKMISFVLLHPNFPQQTLDLCLDGTALHAPDPGDLMNLPSFKQKSRMISSEAVSLEMLLMKNNRLCSLF